MWEFYPIQCQYHHRGQEYVKLRPKRLICSLALWVLLLRDQMTVSVRWGNSEVSTDIKVLGKIQSCSLMWFYDNGIITLQVHKELRSNPDLIKTCNNSWSIICLLLVGTSPDNIVLQENGSNVHRVTGAQEGKWSCSGEHRILTQDFTCFLKTALWKVRKSKNMLLAFIIMKNTFYHQAIPALSTHAVKFPEVFWWKSIQSLQNLHSINISSR